MADAVGPIFAGGFQHIKVGAYELLYLPDLHNDLLQREGKSPVYYWMPAYVRIARTNVDTGPAKFHMIHFVGVQSSDTTVGVSGTREVAGGVITFTTTAAPPAQELEASQQALLNMFRGNDDKFWGWRTSVTPSFRPMPVMAASTSLTNLSPKSNGATLTSTVPRGAGPGALREFRFAPSVRPMTVPQTVREGATDLSANLDPWFINLQGQGEGNINLLGETAYSGLMGSYPAAILWASFHGGTGAIVARQDYKLKFWAPLVEITIRGNWDRIFDHFSAAASAHYLWTSADIQVELNNMRMNGTIEVNVQIDPTIPGADKMQADIDKKTDLVLQKFMDAAQKVIFESPPPKVDPAHADGGSWPWGVGLALKYRRDETKLDLYYHEKREMAYIQNTTISSSLSGFIDEIKADPDAEKRYFTTLYLDDWDRKVTRTVKPIVNWPDPSRKWVGEPVAFLSVQVGYPDVNGSLQWSGHMFQATDPANSVFQPAMAKKKLTDVANPPANWQPDVTFVKRTIHFTEPPDESTYPYARVFIERNQVDLDPGPNGTPTNTINLEVRADSAGKLDVGPISLNVDLDSPKQMVEISFQCLGNTLDGVPRNITKFQWLYSDQTEPRYWAIYTGQLDFVPRFRYQVRVIVKGSLFTKGMEWTGPWVETNGNGPLMLNVPTPEDPGVTVTRNFPESAGAGAPPHMGAGTPTPSTLGAPPPRPSKAPVPAGNMPIYGYKTVPDGIEAKSTSSTSAPKEVPGKDDAKSLSQPIIEGWTTEDPSIKKNRGIYYAR
jgi:hypothetical protein